MSTCFFFTHHIALKVASSCVYALILLKLNYIIFIIFPHHLSHVARVKLYTVYGENYWLNFSTLKALFKFNKKKLIWWKKFSFEKKIIFPLNESSKLNIARSFTNSFFIDWFYKYLKEIYQKCFSVIFC